MAVPWHRVFGMALTQYFAGTGWKVDVEVDLSVQQQRLDLVVLRGGSVSAPVVWPDGFGSPAEHNLLTFKALKDPLNVFALKELAAHGVNYHKLVSPNLDHLLPEEYFRLIAISMQYPRGLAQRVTLRPCGPGAYDVQWGAETIRVLVLREMSGGRAEPGMEPVQQRPSPHRRGVPASATPVERLEQYSE